MEGILRSFLKSHLSSYISSSEDDGSGLSFKGVELRAEEYPRVERFSARSLEILVPWAALARQSIEVHFKGVDLALGCPTTGSESEQTGFETSSRTDGGDIAASTRGRPWDEGELSGSEWREEESRAAEHGEVGGASWVGMSIRSRLIRSGLNVSLFVEDLTFTENLGTHQAIVRVGSLSVLNIPAEDWVGLVRNPDGWLGKAVVLDDVHVSIGQTQMHIGSMHLSSVLPLYEFLAEDFDYGGEGERVVPVSVNVSTLGLEGPRTGTIVGWLMDKMVGEEKENTWSVEVGVTLGELTYQEHRLTGVVVLWCDGTTTLRAERLGTDFGIGWGVFSADNISFRIEDGVARIDDFALVGRAATILAGGVEVGWSDGARLRARSLSCTVMVEHALDIFSEIARGESAGEVVAQTGGPSSSDGDTSDPGDAVQWSMELGMVVLGLQTGDNVVTIWSSGIHSHEGRLGVGCAGVDVDCERLIGTRGAIEAVDADQRRVTFGDVNIWLTKESFGALDRCWDLWKTVISTTKGEQAVVPDGEAGGFAVEKAGRKGGQTPTTVVEFDSLAVRLGEKEGTWAQEVTIVDTRTGERTTAVEGDKVLESIALEDGYSLYEDCDEQGLWYIARPVSFRSLLRKAAKVDGVEVPRNEEVQLYVGPGGGRLCELELEGRKMILGVPGWGGAEGLEDWKVDILAPRPGSTIHLDLGDFSCVLSSSLSTYNRLDILVAPKVLLRSELSCECIVEISGEQSGAIVMGAGMEIGVDVSTTSMFAVVIRNGDVEYRTLPLSFGLVGSRVMTMRPRSDRIDRPGANADRKVELVIDHVAGYAEAHIRPCRETGEWGVGDPIGRRKTLATEPAVHTSTAQRPGAQDRYHDPIDTGDVQQAVNGRSRDRGGTDSDLRQEEAIVDVHMDKSTQDARSFASYADEVVDRTGDGDEDASACDSEAGGTAGRSRWSPGMSDISGHGSVDPNPLASPNSLSRPVSTVRNVDGSGQRAFGATSNPSESKSICSRLEDFFREHNRFNVAFVFDRLRLAWDSDLSDQVISTKFANLEVLSGAQQPVLTVDSACSIAYSADQLVLGLPSISLPLVDQRALDCFRSLHALICNILEEGGDGEVADAHDDGFGANHQTSTSLALVNDVPVACGGVKLATLSLSPIRVVINATQAASGGEFIEHVRNCALRTLPSVAASLALDFLRGLAVKIV